MKTLLTLLAFLLATTIFAQQTNGFWGVPFYAGQATVKDIMLKTKKIKPISENDNTLSYSYADVDGETGGIIKFIFYHDKMFQGSIQLTSSTFEQALSKYNSWRNKLTKKYGKPKMDTYSFPFPTDSFEKNEKALEKYGAEVFAKWVTTDSATSKATVVFLRLGTGRLVNIYIQDCELAWSMALDGSKPMKMDY